MPNCRIKSTLDFPDWRSHTHKRNWSKLWRRRSIRGDLRGSQASVLRRFWDDQPCRHAERRASKKQRAKAASTLLVVFPGTLMACTAALDPFQPIIVSFLSSSSSVAIKNFSSSSRIGFGRSLHLTATEQGKETAHAWSRENWLHWDSLVQWRLQRECQVWLKRRAGHTIKCRRLSSH
jgi:hypothetical protein